MTITNKRSTALAEAQEHKAGNLPQPRLPAFTMNIEEFINAFRRKVEKEGSKWTLECGLLRLGKHPLPDQHSRHCPLTYVAGTFPLGTSLAAKTLGVTYEDAQRIANAADYDTPQGQALRRSLIEAAGLEKEVPTLSHTLT